jgi:AP-4 complex subunit epsilon-1
MDFLFVDKKVPQNITRETRLLIDTIGETRNKETEEEIILREIGLVKEQITQPLEAEEYPDILVKLIYFETLGYDTSFAHILPINLCQSGNMYLKKMAYLLAALLVRPGDKLCVLMHNTIQKDLQSENSFVILTSLTMLRYFLTQDLVPHLLPLLAPLLKHNIAIIRRKSYLLLLDFHQRFGSLPALPPLKPQVVQALSDP